MAKSIKRKRGPGIFIQDAFDDVSKDALARLEAYGERFMEMFDSPPDVQEPRIEKQTNGVTEPAREEATDDRKAEHHRPLVDETEGILNINASKKRIEDNTLVSTEANNPSIDAKLERKRFMSHRADVVARSAPTTTPRAIPRTKGAKEFQELSKEDFSKLQREVNLYGATALDKKSKKQFTSALFQGLGSKAPKGMQVPASIAIGMAKKRKKREAVALEQAVEAGMIKKKGMGRKKRMEKRYMFEHGLMEDGGAFKAGVLRLGKVPFNKSKKGYR